jgi:hypothetical protein
MFNAKLYTTFSLLFSKNKPLFDFRFATNMNSCKFKEIIVFKDFEVDNCILGLDRDCYLSIVKFLDSLILRNVCKYFLFFLVFYLCLL